MHHFAGTEAPLFATGVILGALLLCVGFAVGVWIGRKSTLNGVKSLDNFHLVNLLHGLSSWTNGFASDVSKYREAVQEVWQRIDSAGGEIPTEDPAVVKLLSQIVEANEHLQERLDNAENTLQEQAEEISAYMSEARTDTLTGLPNRRVFDDELARRMAEWRRQELPVAVILGDVDHFKRFNDEHGHLAGDAVLANVARVLRDTMRECDLVARIGGEEFAIILSGAGEQDPKNAADRARAAIQRAEFRYEGHNMQVTMSCGVAQSLELDDISSLVKRADEAMYASKSAGRNSAHYHDGRLCVPITVPSGSPAKTLTAEDFGDVCEALREKLMAVVAEESQSLAAPTT